MSNHEISKVSDNQGRAHSPRRCTSLIFPPYKVSDKLSDDTSEDLIKPLIAKNKDLALFKEIIKKKEDLEKSIEQNKQNVQDILEKDPSLSDYKENIESEIKKQNKYDKKIQKINCKIGDLLLAEKSNNEKIDKFLKITFSPTKIEDIRSFLKKNGILEKFAEQLQKFSDFNEILKKDEILKNWDISRLEQESNNLKPFLAMAQIIIGKIDNLDQLKRSFPPNNEIGQFKIMLNSAKKTLDASPTKGHPLAEQLSKNLEDALIKIENYNLEETSLLPTMELLRKGDISIPYYSAKEAYKELDKSVQDNKSLVELPSVKEKWVQDNVPDFDKLISDFDRNDLNKVVNDFLDKEVKPAFLAINELVNKKIFLLKSMKNILENGKLREDLNRKNKRDGKPLQEIIAEHKEKLKKAVESRLDTIQDLRKRQRKIEKELVYAHDCVNNGKMDSIFNDLTDIAPDAESRTAFFEEWWQTQWEELKQIKEQLEPSPYLAAETQALPQGWRDRQEPWSDDDLKEIMKLDKK